MAGNVTPFADPGTYEAKYKPHPTEVDSNPFSVVDLGGGEAVVADAGGNTLLKVDKHGKVKLIAVLPDQLVATDNLTALLEEALGVLVPGVTCANVGEYTDELEDALAAIFVDVPMEEWPVQVEEFVERCDLPPMIPAEAVATSVAIGPNGVHVHRRPCLRRQRHPVRGGDGREELPGRRVGAVPGFAG